MSVTRTFGHGAATVIPVRISSASETVTVMASSSNIERVWTGTDPRIYVYPWYGTQVAPGGSTTVSASIGQTVYTVSHNEPAQVQVTTST